MASNIRWSYDPAASDIISERRLRLVICPGVTDLIRRCVYRGAPLPGRGSAASTAASATCARACAEEEAMELFIFVTWLVLSGAAAVYASNKGRSGGGIFALSLFLSPLVGFLVAAAMEPHQKEIAKAKGMKKCPDCAEFVQPEAKICRFCRHEFASNTGDTRGARACPKQATPCPNCRSSDTCQLSATTVQCRKCGKQWTLGIDSEVSRITDALACPKCGSISLDNTVEFENLYIGRKAKQRCRQRCRCCDCGYKWENVTGTQAATRT